LIPASILGDTTILFLVAGIHSLVRKDGLAAIAFVSLYALPPRTRPPYATIELPTQIVVYAIAVPIVFRFGLIPLAAAIFTVNMADNLPISADFSAWYMTGTLLTISSIVVLAGVGPSLIHWAASRSGKWKWSKSTNVGLGVSASASACRLSGGPLAPLGIPKMRSQSNRSPKGHSTARKNRDLSALGITRFSQPEGTPVHLNLDSNALKF
jgi:hypothetical protein